MPESPDPGDKFSFEEFKLFYESTEKVTDRRLSANRWNYSICTAIVVAIAGLFNWGLTTPAFLIVAVVAGVLLSGMAALFCSLWIGQIRDFKELNNAKFTVLNHMASHVTFGDTEGDPRVSYCPFQREWEALQEAKAVQEVATQKIIALKASNMEYLVPKAFRVLFIGVAVAVILFLGINWSQIINSSTLTIPAKTATTPAVTVKP